MPEMSSEDTTSSSGSGEPAIVLDIGSCFTKCGFSGDDEPKSVFPTIIGNPINPEMIGVGCKTTYVGTSAMEHRGGLRMCRPINEGCMTNMDAIEQIVHNAIYNELRADPSSYHCLMTDKLFSPKKQREDLCMMMFENFNMTGYFVYNQCLLAMYSGVSSETTGVIVDCSDGLTEIVPIYEGFVLHYQSTRSKISGAFVTNQLKTLMQTRGIVSETTGDVETIRQVKENVCYVASDYTKQNEDNFYSPIENVYELPDGTSIHLDQECFKAPEVLFNPLMVGVECPGIPEQIYNAIMKCPIEIRRKLFGNIILEGGTSKMTGFKERVEIEMAKLVPESVKVNILLSDIEHGAWMGGAVLSTMMAFQENLITKEEYEESGPYQSHKRCYFEDF